MLTHTYRGTHGDYLTSVVVSSTDNDRYHDFDGLTLKQFREAINKLSYRVPEKYDNEAVVSVNCHDDYGAITCSISISYTRPATDLEIQQFKSREDTEKNRKIKNLEQELKRLKNETSN